MERVKIKSTWANWYPEIIIGFGTLVSILVLLLIMLPIGSKEVKDIAMNLFAEVFGILITAVVIVVISKERERVLDEKHLNLLIAHNLDRFQGYLEDLGDVLDELKKDSDNKLFFERLKRILLHANTLPMFQFFKDHKLSGTTGSAVNIVVKIQEKLKGTISFSELGFSNGDLIQLRACISEERLKLVKARVRYESHTLK